MDPNEACLTYLRLNPLPIYYSEFDPIQKTTEHTIENIKNPCLSQRKLAAVEMIFNEIARTLTDLKKEDLYNVKQEIVTNVQSLKKPKKVCAFEIKNELFVIAKEKRDNIKTIEIAKRTKLIKEGGYGKVYSAKNLSTQTEPWVMKLAKIDDKSRITKVYNYLKNEIDILCQNNPEGKLKLLQPAPRFVFEYTTPSSITQIGYLTDKLSGNCDLLFMNNKLSFEKRSSLTEQLLGIMNELESLDLYHGDISILNILFQEVNDKIQLLLIDFAYSIGYKQLALCKTPFLNDLRCKGKPSMISKTSYYQLNREIDKFHQCIYRLEGNIYLQCEEREKKKIEYFNDNLKPLFQERDRFAMGLIIYALWTGKWPPCYSFTPQGLKDRHLTSIILDKADSITQQMILELNLNKTPNDIVNTIFSYLDPRYQTLQL